MEAVRIIKEMRNATRQLPVCGADDDRRVYPRIAIWENVVGAYSSNNGEDFRCVLEELARIENPEVSIPKPKKWSNAGCIELPHGCITWRTHDAQYFGVPQRRRRISLVVDFRDRPEPQIQFIEQSLSGDIEQSKQTGETTSGNVGEGTYTTVSFQERGGKPGGVKEYSSNTTESEPCQHLQTKLYCNSSGEEVSGTLDASYYKGCGERQGTEREVVCVGNGQLMQAELSEKVGALNCMHDQQAIILLESNQNHATIQTDGISTTLPASMGMGGGYVPMVCKENVCYGLDRASFNQGQNAKYDISFQEDIAQPIVARGPGGVMQTKETHSNNCLPKGEK